MKTLHIVLLVMIIVGLGLIASQSLWVGAVVDEILILQGETPAS